MQPLIENRDYGTSGLDQLEKQYVSLPDMLQKQVKRQFKNRVKESNMSNVEKIATEILAAEEKEAVSPKGWKGTTEAMKSHKNITNPWALCFTADTKVPLLDGRVLTMIELVKEFGNDKDTYVYSYDIENDKVVVGRAFNFHKTAENANVLEIELDNGQKIKCTLFHKFLMQDGSYKEAKNLKSNDSLMPIYFDRHEGSFCQDYKRVWSKDGKKHFVHRIVAAYNFGKEWQSGFINHHYDFNKDNNHPENIKIMTASDHSKFHRQQDGAKHLIEYIRSEKGRKMSSINGKKNMKKLWQEQREQQIENCKKNGQLGAETGRKALLKFNNSQKTKDAVAERTLNGSMTKGKITKIAAKIISLGLDVNEATWSEHKGYASSPNFSTAIELFNDVETLKKYAKDRSLYGSMIKSRILKVAKRILDAVLPINEDTWERFRRTRKNPPFDKAIEKFGSIDNIVFETEKRHNMIVNHKVINVRLIDIKEDVYDFTVDKYHNFALDAGVFVHNSWWMSKKKPGESWGKGGKLTKKPEPHYKEKKSFDEKVSAIIEMVEPAEVSVEEFSLPMVDSTKKYSTEDSIKTDDGYITIKSNYDEKNGEPLLEEYIVDKNGDVETYNDVESFAQRLISEGLL
jgi:hypothetical protein